MTTTISAILIIALNCAHHSFALPNVPAPSADHIAQLPGPRQKQKQNIQQFQVSVVLPPGSPYPPNQAVQGSQPPGPPKPGFIWVQVPVPVSTQPPQSSNPPPVWFPANPPNTSPPFVPAVQQPAPPSGQQPPQNPPIIEVDNSLLAKSCLRPRGQFSSRSCNKYINCWDGQAVEQDCPDGLLFSPKGYCDYPENVNCGGRPIEVTTAATPLGPGHVPSPPTLPQVPSTVAPPVVIATLPPADPNLRKKCLKPRGQFASDSCNKYVNCWDDVILEQECPEGLLFSNKGYCDYPHNVDCQHRIPPRYSNVPKDCPFDEGTFRDKLNCSRYFTCTGGKVVATYDCPSGLSFSNSIGVCDYNERVDCNQEPFIYYPKEFSPQENFLASVPNDVMVKLDDCKPGTVYRLNPQCTAACLCRDGLSEVIQCPQGLAYDSKTDKCLLPHLAKC